jgi:hypothetical protein
MSLPVVGTVTSLLVPLALGVWQAITLASVTTDFSMGILKMHVSIFHYFCKMTLEVLYQCDNMRHLVASPENCALFAHIDEHVLHTKGCCVERRARYYPLERESVSITV